MKICPKCQTKNEDSSNFCKRCGFKLSISESNQKREMILGKKRKRSFGIPVILAFIIIVLAGVGYWIIQGKTTSASKTSSQPKIKGRFVYSGQKILMADILAKMDKGKISIPLEIIKEKKLVRFEYEGNGIKIPLLAYIAPSGRLITAVSMCEPCRSTRFHINGNKLVCNACYTEWDLESLKGIRGGCLDYPPDVIPSTIDGNQIRIDEKVVFQWKPRV